MMFFTGLLVFAAIQLMAFIYGGPVYGFAALILGGLTILLGWGGGFPERFLKAPSFSIAAHETYRFAFLPTYLGRVKKRPYWVWFKWYRECLEYLEDVERYPLAEIPDGFVPHIIAWRSLWGIPGGNR